jgi:hypothetical protein
MIGTELAERIALVIKRIFPNSYIESRYSTSLCESIDVRFALGKNSSEWKNGIIQNDPAYTVIHIYPVEDGYQVVSNCIGFRNRTTYKTDNLGWRDAKKPITEEKVISVIKTYFEKLSGAIDESRN